MRVCSVKGCTNKHKSLGLCNKHYLRQRIHGDVGGRTQITKDMTLKEKLYFHSSWNGGCLEWHGTFTRGGYGTMGWKNGKVSAHRLAYIAEHGDIPGGFHVLHKCDNRKCINPEHLFLGTNSDNMADMMEKNRQNQGSECCRAKITEDDVIQIRKFAKEGSSYKELSNSFGVDKSTIGRIVRRDNWTHI